MMKKYLKPIVFAVALGCLFGYLFFKKDEPLIEEVINESKLVSFIQVGVFNNYDNALNKKNDFNPSIIVNDDGKYRVFIGIFDNTEVINKMKVLYSAHEYDYYIKKDNINNKEFLNYLSNAQNLMLNTEDEKALNKIVKEILDKYMEVVK